jgi:transposase
MVVIGIDTHKRSHTAVAVNEVGRKLGERTTGTTSPDHLELLAWADRFGDDRIWAIEDCRQMSRRLEHDLLTAGQRVVRVPPKLMAHARDAARTRGKSDPIDALAVARAALREPGLPTAALDGPEREIGLLVDHRDHLVAERTRTINRLRWHLHELDPSIDPPARSLIRIRQLNIVAARISGFDHLVARLARDLVARCRELTEQILELERELAKLVADLAPGLLGIYGCSTLTAAKILAETAGIHRFRSKAAYAMHNGTAPLPVWSGNRERYRLNRRGNRQLNAALHRIAITQSRHDPESRAYLQKRIDGGDTKREAIRALRRRLSDVVYRTLRNDHKNAHVSQALT